MSPITCLLLFSTLIHYTTRVTSYPETELIKNLPGQPTVNFKQFAGYVTVDEAQQRHLFYYFVEAETNPDSKPLVLWLNGGFLLHKPGPVVHLVGYGAFLEHGPFRPSENGLVTNEYSWNKEANMLYLETPAGVGFSYSSNKSFYNSVNDEITAKDNLEFLQKWLTKFPEYKKSDLFITGESYAGHYVPQLADLILKTNLGSNLKGIALGNPLLEFNTDFNSRGEYLWSHGIISDATYGLLQNVCNYSQIRRQYYKQAFTPECGMVLNKMNSEMSVYLNPYDIIVDVCLYKQKRFLAHYLKDEKLDACQEDKTTNYLKKQEVQKALHAQLVGVTEWTICSSVVNYHVDDTEVSTLPLLATLMRLGVRVLLYSGDQDTVIPLTGTRTLANRLAVEMGLNETVPYNIWLQDNQIGGWTQAFGDNILTFATVRGAAHEVPFSQPARSMLLFSSFLQGKPLPKAP
ncbi:serine carboxypeptidase-like 45 [Silene latifolia]|uniref:serine carboxypeptidase-like 45 n=1 Tax=Silene latifolia TaxID=37657 RepID=UPI003D78A101